MNLKRNGGLIPVSILKYFYVSTAPTPYFLRNLKPIFTETIFEYSFVIVRVDDYYDVILIMRLFLVIVYFISSLVPVPDPSRE